MLPAKSIGESLNAAVGDLEMDIKTSKTRFKMSSLPLIKKCFVEKKSSKALKTNPISIANQLLEKSSWCHPKPDMSNNQSQAQILNSSTQLQQTYSSLPNSNYNNLKSLSKSPDYSDDDFLYDNPFLKKLKTPSVVQKIHSSFYGSNDPSEDSLNTNFVSFFPEDTVTNSPSVSLESQEEYKKSGPLNNHPKYRQFEQQFHWSQNIEHCSPWVRQRSKEIYNHVSGLLEQRKTEVSEELSEEISNDLFAENQETDIVRDESSITNDGITYEIASKLCNTFIKHNETNTTENLCSCDDNFKWTKLYQKLVNSQLI